jgi:cyclopropane fatty-acyl-phospholipid synthase-like methyltransferase
MNAVAICSFWSCGSGNEVGLAFERKSAKAVAIVLLASAATRAQRRARATGLSRNFASRAHGARGRSKVCDAEYRVEAGERGQT